MGDFSTAVLADTPAAYWRLGEASGTFADSSGNGHTTATPINSVLTYGQTSLVRSDPTNNAALFNGGQANITGYVFNTVPFTVLVLCNVVQLKAPGRFISCGGSAIGGWGVGQTGGTFFLTGFGVADVTFNSSSMVVGATYITHYIFRADTSVDLYVNGVFIQNKALGALVATTQPVIIGNQASGTAEPPNAVLDEVALFSSALSSVRIAAHASAALGSLAVANPDLSQFPRGGNR